MSDQRIEGELRFVVILQRFPHEPQSECRKDVARTLVDYGTALLTTVHVPERLKLRRQITL